MKEQIEEMKEVLCDVINFDICNKFDHCDDCPAMRMIDVLYNAGYRKQIEGKWEKANDGTHWCSECGHDAPNNYGGAEILGVACPYCGAKMKGGAE